MASHLQNPSPLESPSILSMIPILFISLFHLLRHCLAFRILMKFNPFSLHSLLSHHSSHLGGPLFAWCFFTSNFLIMSLLHFTPILTQSNSIQSNPLCDLSLFTSPTQPNATHCLVIFQSTFIHSYTAIIYYNCKA